MLQWSVTGILGARMGFPPEGFELEGRQCPPNYIVTQSGGVICDRYRLYCTHSQCITIYIYIYIYFLKYTHIYIHIYVGVCNRGSLCKTSAAARLPRLPPKTRQAPPLLPLLPPARWEGQASKGNLLYIYIYIHTCMYIC